MATVFNYFKKRHLRFPCKCRDKFLVRMRFLVCTLSMWNFLIVTMNRTILVTCTIVLSVLCVDGYPQRYRISRSVGSHGDIDPGKASLFTLCSYVYTTRKQLHVTYLNSINKPLWLSGTSIFFQKTLLYLDEKKYRDSHFNFPNLCFYLLFILPWI